LPARIAVCDVGGASTEIAVGSPGHTPEWIVSVDLGSVRLSTRADGLETARRAAAEAPRELSRRFGIDRSARRSCRRAS